MRKKVKLKNTLRPSPDALLNPKADPIFKLLFTDHSTDSRMALTEFLTALIGEEVSQVKLLPNILTSESKNDRQTEFDLSCKIGYDKFANVEMQGNYHHKDYDNRSEYHVAHLLNHFVGKGTNWDKIPIAYQISVMNFVYDKTSDNDINHYYMQTDDGHSLNNRMNIIFLELPKFKKYLNCNVEDLTSIQRWGLFFLYADSLEHTELMRKIALEERGIMFAFKALSKISISDLIWLQQKNYWDNISNIKSMKSTAREEGLAEGRAEGLAEGRNKGLKEGLAEGREKGLTEGRNDKLMELVSKKLEKNKTPEQIADECEENLELILNLIQQIKKKQIN